MRRDPATELAFLLAAAGLDHPGLSWVEHATRRLDAGDRAYGDRWTRQTLADLLRELTEEAADLGACAALAAQHPALLDLADDDRGQIAEALAVAARHGARAHAALRGALAAHTPAGESRADAAE